MKISSGQARKYGSQNNPDPKRLAKTGAFFLAHKNVLMKRFASAFILISGLAGAQPTIGLIKNSPPAIDGYTLFAPIRSYTTYLVDNCGHAVNQWTSQYKPGNSVYFLPDGELLRTG